MALLCWCGVVSMLVVRPPFVTHSLRNVMDNEQVCDLLFVLLLLLFSSLVLKYAMYFSFQASSNFHCFGSLGRF